MDWKKVEEAMSPEPDTAAHAEASAKTIHFKRVDDAKGDLRLAWTGYSREFKGRGPFEASEEEWAALAKQGLFEKEASV